MSLADLLNDAEMGEEDSDDDDDFDEGACGPPNHPDAAT